MLRSIRTHPPIRPPHNIIWISIPILILILNFYLKSSIDLESTTGHFSDAQQGEILVIETFNFIFRIIFSRQN